MPTRGINGWFLADRRVCGDCGKPKYTCARCGERFHSAGRAEDVRMGKDDDSPADGKYVMCDSCYRKFAKWTEKKRREN